MLVLTTPVHFQLFAWYIFLPFFYFQSIYVFDIHTKYVYYFPMVAVIKYHKLGGLKQQKFFLLQFWKLEVQNQSVGKTMFSLVLGRILSCLSLVSSNSQLSLAFPGL